MTVSQHPTILVYRNGQWSHLPHAQFFGNMLQQDLKKVAAARRTYTELQLRTHLANGEVVTVNKAQFRYKHESKQGVTQ